MGVEVSAASTTPPFVRLCRTFSPRRGATSCGLGCPGNGKGCTFCPSPGHPNPQQGGLAGDQQPTSGMECRVANRPVAVVPGAIGLDLNVSASSTPPPVCPAKPDILPPPGGDKLRIGMTREWKRAHFLPIPGSSQSSPSLTPAGEGWRSNASSARGAGRRR